MYLEFFIESLPNWPKWFHLFSLFRGILTVSGWSKFSSHIQNYWKQRCTSSIMGTWDHMLSNIIFPDAGTFCTYVFLTPTRTGFSPISFNPVTEIYFAYANDFEQFLWITGLKMKKKRSSKHDRPHTCSEDRTSEFWRWESRKFRRGIE